jgi:predicted RNA-binding protein with PIN domain
MPYLIDGHNLIPTIPDLSLDELDDEIRLLELLLRFCRKTGKKAHVYFDQAPVGQSRVQSFGSVVAHFVGVGQTADDAIYKHLKRLKNEAKNWTVVSSDRGVASSARHVHAKVISSANFARKLQETDQHRGKTARSDFNISPEEIKEWLRLFGNHED